MTKGQCKLCLENKDLCSESHIIPHFLYKFITGENNALVFLDSSRATTRYNSEYEGNILCQDCDNRLIGQLDSYAAEFMHLEFGLGPAVREITLENKPHIVYENHPAYDYKRFKLFLLSVLWRCSISSRMFFSRIKFPVEIEEDLRSRILRGDEGPPDLYPWFITLPPVATIDGKTGFHTIYMPTISPLYLETGKLKICELIIQGVRYYCIISKPTEMKVYPGITENKLTMGFATIEQQNELIQKALDLLKGHKQS